MKYCTNCFYPDTKPDIWFDSNGKCAACIAFDGRANIDWKARDQEFADIAYQLRTTVGDNGYHCVVPVSGGKDSTCQVLKCLEHGLNPLAICAVTDDLSNIGRANLSNISNLGVDCVEVKTNTAVRRRIAKYALETIGDISWAEHVTIFTIPVQEAINRKIPAIIWGENSQNEYGGPQEHQTKENLDVNWLNEFGGLNGLRVKDLLDAKIATKKELLPYISWGAFPGKSIFLGHYFPWDGKKNAELAIQNGFNTWDCPVSGSGVNYENLDNYQTGIHDFFKYIKFGFGRATDIANNHIRRGYWTREQGRDHILRYDGEYPYMYLDKKLCKVLAEIDVSMPEFLKIMERFTNKELFNIEVNNDWFSLEPKFMDQLKGA